MDLASTLNLKLRLRELGLPSPGQRKPNSQTYHAILNFSHSSPCLFVYSLNICFSIFNQQTRPYHGDNREKIDAGQAYWASIESNRAPMKQLVRKIGKGRGGGLRDPFDQWEVCSMAAALLLVGFSAAGAAPLAAGVKGCVGAVEFWSPCWRELLSQSSQVIRSP